MKNDHKAFLSSLDFFSTKLLKRKLHKNTHFSTQNITFGSKIVSVLWLFKILYISAPRSFLNRYLYDLHFIAEPCNVGT
ncbi:Uncharacterised protein [Porphyromonas crevioricanis]|uniref:Uncharacterized protein n=1 Tax=Porphyromonas crevioricanis TaxID=393921 RepID=A0A2X4PND9_9PORP|nr:Uncharacterised protein [Porphyromonas crevioricanis]